MNAILLNTKYSLIFISTQYNSLNVNLSHSELNKFKSAIKNETELGLRLSSIMIDDNENDFSHQLLLTNRQVPNIRKAFANNSSINIKLSKTQLSKMMQEDFLVDYLAHY